MIFFPISNDLDRCPSLYGDAPYRYWKFFLLYIGWIKVIPLLVSSGSIKYVSSDATLDYNNFPAYRMRYEFVAELLKLV
jgi:hypothetical protein